jgi:succinate dehydrogenase / fumarate reductase cytochrome b subunit
LLAMLIIHVWTALRLYFENRAARPIGYKRKVYQEATLSSRTMIWTGIGVFLFVVYHLMHFTLIITNPQYSHLEDALGRHDVYSMVILGFQNYLISAVYIVSIAIVSYHLVHASKSMFQTWGLNDTNFEKILRPVTVLFAWLIFLGYVSIPIAVLTGFVKLPEGVI